MVPPHMTSYLKIDRIGKSYGSTRVLQDVSLDVAPGEFTVLLGPSGCGKSTLLRIIAGLLDSDSGTLMLQGDDITAQPAWDRDIGLVFQNYALFPHMSVAENVAFGLDMRNLPKAEIRSRVAEALDAVRLGEFGNRKPAALSGGQQQRVAIARAIAIKPRLLLLDEPLSNLDAVLRASVRTELRELHDRTGITTIMVTHDQAEALSIGDRIVLMNEGRVIQNDTPEAIYREPASAFAAAFIGSPPANLLPLPSAPEAKAAGWTPPPALAPHLDGGCLVALRPEALKLSAEPTPQALPAHLKRIEFQGADRFAHVEALGHPLIVRLGDDQSLTRSDVWLTLPDSPRVFSKTTGAPVAPATKG